jgi:hypothetical protein
MANQWFKNEILKLRPYESFWNFKMTIAENFSWVIDWLIMTDSYTYYNIQELIPQKSHVITPKVVIELLEDPMFFLFVVFKYLYDILMYFSLTWSGRWVRARWSPQAMRIPNMCLVSRRRKYLRSMFFANYRVFSKIQIIFYRKINFNFLNYPFRLNVDHILKAYIVFYNNLKLIFHLILICSLQIIGG